MKDQLNLKLRLLTALGAITLSATSFAIAATHDLMSHTECKGQKQLDSIKFNNEFFADINDGKKVASTRLKVRCFSANSIVKMQDPDGKDLGQLKITQVSKLMFKDLTVAHAKKENATLEELKAGLTEIYGKDVKSTPLSFVEFQVVKP